MTMWKWEQGPYKYGHLKDLEVVPHPLWHLKDLEVVPHPRGGGKCYPRWILQINREVENERKPKNPKFDRCFTIFVYCFYQKSNMILWSIRTFWYKGSAENKTKIHVREKRYISQKQQPKTQIMIFQKNQIWSKYVNIG